MTFRAGAALMFSIALTGFDHASGAENAVVSKLNIYPGQEIRLDALADIDVSQCGNCRAGFFRDRSPLNGMIAAKTILAGRLIYPELIRKSPAVLQRQHVDIFLVAGALTISMRGEALEAGAVGDVVHVRNLDSGLSIAGIVIADGSVSAGSR